MSRKVKMSQIGSLGKEKTRGAPMNTLSDVKMDNIKDELKCDTEVANDKLGGLA